MSFTVIFAVLAILVLVIIFGVSYFVKGLKTAFIVTGIAFVVIAILFLAMINAIVSVM